MTAARVLVADDDADIRTIFAAALKPAFDVTAVRDGLEAKEFLEQNDVACVVADHMMPGMSGIDVCLCALSLQPSAARVLVTASERVQDLSDAVNIARVHRFLSKPVRIMELVAAVKEAVHTVALERENDRLVEELRGSEKRLEKIVEERTRDLRAANAELEQLALRDGLTGLYNHRFFQEAIAAEMSRAARYNNPVALVFLDVDNFKNYNDTCGHPAGDTLLRDLARLLVSTDVEMRHRGRTSDMAARYGGEEFVLILPVTDREGALVRAERVREMIAAHPFARKEVQPLGHVSISAGVAAYPRDATDKVALIKRADDALLAAKRAGRNRVVPAAPWSR